MHGEAEGLAGDWLFVVKGFPYSCTNLSLAISIKEVVLYQSLKPSRTLFI